MLNVGLFTLGMLAGWLLLWRIPILGRAQTSTSSVSVLIPARNEASSIGHLLASLSMSELEPDEVIVVDDDSDDATADIARAAGVRVVSAGPLGRGWTGKSWACQRGADVAAGEILVFLDADVELGRSALARVVGEVTERGGLVSVQPFHRVERPYEWASLFFNLVTMMGTGFAAIRRPRQRAMAFGPVLACRAEDYRRVGGHASVRSAVAEDLALSAEFERAEFSVSVFGGRDQISFRMYPDGLAQLAEGWSKNMATGASSAPRLAAAGSALWITASLVAGPLAIAAVLSGSSLWALGLWAVFAAQLAVLSRRIGSFPIWASLLHPIGSVLFVAVFVRSLVLTRIRRSVSWRGRQIAVAAAAGR